MAMGTLTARQQLVLHAGMCELVLPQLRTSRYYPVALEATHSVWSWIERGDITGDTLNDLVWNDDDRGVMPPMTVEAERARWNAWGCITDTVALAAFLAYTAEGAESVPEILEMADSQETLDDFSQRFDALFPGSEVLARITAELRTMNPVQFTREGIRVVVQRIARECGVTLP